VYSTEQLEADLELIEGDSFNQRHLAADVRQIKEKYGRLGRLFAKADPLTRFDD
jgi:outer membrane protein assembly factor BamA